jgi:antitoxin MazE
VPSYDLDHLIGGMMDSTFPETVDFGPEVGNEAW